MGPVKPLADLGGCRGIQMMILETKSRSNGSVLVELRGRVQNF